MRQVLFNSARALVVRMPRPTPGPGAVLVRTRFSLISAGTELASLRPLTAGLGGATTGERVSDLANRAGVYLGKAVRNPRLAAERVRRIVENRVQRQFQAIMPKPAAKPAVPVGPIVWERQAARECAQNGGGLHLVSGGEPGHYQAASQRLEVPGAGYLVEIRLKGRLERGSLMLGLLNEGKSSWLGMAPLPVGTLDETRHFDPGESRAVTLMLTNPSDPGENRLTLDTAEVAMMPAVTAGVPVTEMTDQGWNVGYSVAGEIVAIGDEVTRFAVGDRVACAGAGQANHADYVAVASNLVCAVPAGCSFEEAATTTIGAIALQGVRRAAPLLGEVVCVIGLGLIGMITAQLLRANGCRVIAHDLDAERVQRALKCGVSAAATEADAVARLVRDATDGQGADVTIITAASKSNAPINAAMEFTRRRGRVVIVGDVGLKVEREVFYRKEIDLLMSTSYGPGRYDREYEDHGRDYPYGYVRWTLNRNMQAYLAMIAERRLDIAGLIDAVVPVDAAPETYARLAAAGGKAPLATLLSYPDAPGVLSDAPDAPLIHLRGHRKPAPDRLGYALVGAGGFGTQMLVPMMERRKDRFDLRGVVSRDAVRGGNFARAKQVEIFSSSYEEILADDRIDLVVLATRHDEHAAQVVAALRAGKHVFVEKPLALSWDQLDMVRETLADIAEPPGLMVGFNRRFAPALERLKQELGERHSPLVVNYRVNAGYIPLDNWVQGREGGGRNLGEACHMYDVFAALTGGVVSSVSATAIDPGAAPYLRSDNFVATIRYTDGSVCTLTYTALGPKTGLAKERIEIFANGDAYIVDDYKSLRRASDDAVLWSGGTSDKGHFEELSQFGDALTGHGDMPIAAEHLFATTAVALHVEDQLYGRGETEPA